MTHVLPLLRNIPVLLLFVLSACSTTYPRFREQSKVDLAVHFVSWQAITVTKPRIKEDFVTYSTRTDVERHLASIKTTHHLAVVVCHFKLQPEQQAENQRIWREIFTNLGFERVVFLQGRESSRLNGSQVLNDMQLAQPTQASS
jgi:hypothetical protein